VDPLDNVSWSALTGPHARFAEVNGRAARYDQEVSPFTALADSADPAAWTDLSELFGPGTDLFVSGAGIEPPAGWECVRGIQGVQLVDDGVTGAPDPEAVELGAADVPEVLDLVERTRPGPFRKRTMELGTYLGLRRDGKLIAMAGERMRIPGWTEISAVCTDPDHRGLGLGERLIRAIVAEIRARGDRPFLHTGADNAGAIRLYRRLGFAERTPVVFGTYRDVSV
jgi:ribosomal protein S18 acetylase RimI-like enzyme